MHRLVLGNPLAALVAPILLCVLARKLLNKRRASAHRNAEDPNPGAPHPSTPPIGRRCDVFLSFRGVDTRKTFADHLYSRLLDAGIHVFGDDDELRQGDTIGSLQEAIESSKILIPIISENYASSKWCLQELVIMLECKKRSGHKVFPIFYRVAPADVRHLTGRFGDAFRYYSKRFFSEDMAKWKQALAEVGSLCGWVSERVATGHEGELVKMIVQTVFSELKKEYLVVGDYLVGIDSHVKKVMDLVNCSSGATLFVGIYGMVGIGKTTLAKVIYNMLCTQFESCTFIADIRELCQRNGFLYLQNKLIFDILGEKIQVCDYHEGINIISSRFADKKVLLILDDVATSEELKALAGNPDWFGRGSRILVTTRNESVLDRSGVEIKYRLEEMDEEQSLVLFSRCAFRRDSPPVEFLSLSRLVVSATGGLPLALEVFGSLLCGKELSLWRDLIQKMEKVPHVAVQEKLRISYEELDWEEKQIFLDIACFLIGSDARVACYMWDACGFFAMEGIEVLKSLSLIKIGDNHELKMHNQIRDLGRKIVHEKNIFKPHHHSRLWDYEEALEVLVRKEGNDEIEAIYLEKGNLTVIADVKDQGGHIFTNEHFKNLSSLRFLHMSEVHLIGDFEDTFSELRWLKWGNCPPTFEAINFHPKELVILDLSGSLISECWLGWSSMMMAEKLKVLNLTGCHHLKNTSYLSAFKRLEILILRDCCQLEQIDPCIGDVETLLSLDLSGCLHLEELPSQVGKLENLEELLLDQTMLREIPSSFDSLKMLERLTARDCKYLPELPYSIGHLVNLSTLDLSGCIKLVALPESIGALKKLEVLNISHTAIKELPNGLGKMAEKLKVLNLTGCHHLKNTSYLSAFKRLEMLILRDCCQLEQIDPCIGDVETLFSLDLSGCLHLKELPPQVGKLVNLKELLLDKTMLREIPSSFGCLKMLETLTARDCKSLLELPYSIGHLANLSTLDLSGCIKLVALPESIRALKKLEILNISHTAIKELPNGIDKLGKL